MFGIFKKISSVNLGAGLLAGDDTYLWLGCLAEPERLPVLWRLGEGALFLEDDFAAELAADSPDGIDLQVQVQLAEAEKEFWPLNPERILLLSAGMESKVRTRPQGTARLTSVARLTVRRQEPWKLTLLDGAREHFVVGTARLEERVLAIPYRNAVAYHPVAAPDERISAIVTDKDCAEVKYYGNIALPMKTKGEARLDMTSVDWAAGDRLFVFSEQCNGYMRTDFASPLQEVPLTKGARGL